MSTITRADSFTQLKKKQEYFSDFLNNFAKSPIGEQLGRVTNEQSVAQSLRNLVKTNLGERLWQPQIGSDINASLFENNSHPLNRALEYYIERTIRLNEPRVYLIGVQVNSTENTNFSTTTTRDNELEVLIRYTLINNPEQLTLNFILKRIR